ncbi:MAG TPA: hypothetical protein VH475_12585 [Tepidisphaeraceae bacterium]
MTRAACLALTLTIFLGAISASAVPPTCDGLFPAGGARGATVNVTASGKLDPWPIGIWTDHPGLRVEVGKTAGSLTIHIAPDAPIGPHLLRFYNPEGASTLRCFFVGDQREMTEVEPNDEREKAQVVSELPVTINGQLGKSGDFDCYAVHLQANQCLVASAQGRRLGSAIDPMLHLLDPAGIQVAYAQDGLGLDPLLVYRAPAAGTYILRISAFAFPPAADVKLAGGKDAAYRLNLTTGPFVRGACPAGIQRGTKATVRLLGWNLATDHAEVDATSIPAGVDHLFIPIPGGEGRLRVEVPEGPELEASAAKSPISPPASINGAIAKPGQVDHFTLKATKGQRLAFVVRAGAMGSALDAVLRIEDSTGKQVGADDDAGGTADPKLDWTAPADGVYRLTLADVYGRGGDDYRYWLDIRRSTPELRATLDADAYAIPAGKSAPLKLTVARRNGDSGKVVAVAAELPPGVTATSADVPASGGEITLTVTAAANAKPANTSIRVLLLGTDATNLRAIPAQYELRKDREKAGGQEFIDETASVWLTVAPAGTVTKEPEK